MDSNQTLHDFVLNLITNAEARSAFQLDPEATLAEAGLGDITAADVQDVVPLVVDYTSVQGDAGLASALGGPELDALDAGPADVIGQLQAVTQQLSVTGPAASIDGNIAAVGTIAVDSTNLGVTATNLTGAGVAADPSGVSADLSGAQDVAATLDAGVVGPVSAEATGTVDAAVGTADGAVGGTLDGVVGGTLDGVVGGTLDGVVGGTLDGAVGGTLDGAVGGTLDGAVGGTLDGIPGGLTAPLDDPAGLIGSLPEGGISVPDVDIDDASSPVGGVTGAVDETLDGVGDGGLLASGSASAEASADGTAGSGDLLDDATDILF